MIEFDAADAGRHADAFERLRSDALHAVIVHGVYSPEALAPVVERLERHDPPFLQTWFPEPFRSFFYGRNLNLAAPDLAGYFAEANEFAGHLGKLFPAGIDLTLRVAGRAVGDRPRPAFRSAARSAAGRGLHVHDAPGASRGRLHPGPFRQ